MVLDDNHSVDELIRSNSVACDDESKEEKGHDKGQKNNDIMSDVDHIGSGDESNHSNTSNSSEDSNRKKGDNNKKKEDEKSMGLVDTSEDESSDNNQSNTSDEEG